MKKKLLAIILSVVMVFSAVAVLAACDDTNGPSGGGNYPEGLPVEEGKITFYATIENYEMPEYASPFLLGPYLLPEGESAWAPYAAEMKNLEGTNVWYYVLDKANLDTTVEKYNNYMIDLGYNANSGLPAEQQGEAGLYLKSDETAAPGGMDNPSFTYKVGDRAIDLGAHHFTLNAISEPVKVENVELRVTFAKALGENAKVVINGSFLAWGAWDVEMHPLNEGEEGEDRTIWVYTLDEALAGISYEYLVLVCEDTTKIAVPSVEEDDDDADEPAATADEFAYDVWNDVLASDETVHAWIKVYNSMSGNMTYTFVQYDSDEYVDLCGTKSVTNTLGEKSGLDLSKAVKTEDVEDDGETPKGTYTMLLDTAEPIEITLSLKFDKALPAGYTVWLMGEGELLGNWTTSTALQFTSEDRIVWTHTLTIDVILLGTTSNVYKVVVVAGDAAAWGNEYGGNAPTMGGADNAAGFTFAEEVELFGGVELTQNFPELGETVTVTLTVEFDSAIPSGQIVYLVGSGIDGLTWDENSLQMEADENRTKFTVEVSAPIGTTIYFKVVVCAAGPIDWTHQYGNGSENAQVVIEAAGELALFNSVLTYSA